MNAEREKTGDICKVIRKNPDFFEDFEPVFGYAFNLYLMDKFKNLADIKEIPYGRNT